MPLFNPFPTVETWADLDLSTAWANAGPPFAVAQWAKYGDEIVFQGMLRTTNPSAVIMILPVAIRPAAIKVLPCIGLSNSFGWGTSGLYIGTDGTCLATHGYTDLFCLDGIRFVLDF